MLNAFSPDWGGDYPLLTGIIFPLYSRTDLRTAFRTLDPIPRVHALETISLNLIHSVALGLVGALDVDLYMPSTGGQIVWIKRS